MKGIFKKQIKNICNHKFEKQSKHVHIRRKTETIIEDSRKIAERAEKNVPRLTAFLFFICSFLYMWLVMFLQIFYVFADFSCLVILLISERRLIKSLRLWSCQFLPFIQFLLHIFCIALFSYIHIYDCYAFLMS